MDSETRELPEGLAGMAWGDDDPDAPKPLRIEVKEGDRVPGAPILNGNEIDDAHADAPSDPVDAKKVQPLNPEVVKYQSYLKEKGMDNDAIARISKHLQKHDYSRPSWVGTGCTEREWEHAVSRERALHLKNEPGQPARQEAGRAIRAAQEMLLDRGAWIPVWEPKPDDGRFKGESFKGECPKCAKPGFALYVFDADWSARCTACKGKKPTFLKYLLGTDDAPSEPEKAELSTRFPGAMMHFERNARDALGLKDALEVVGYDAVRHNTRTREMEYRKVEGGEWVAITGIEEDRLRCFEIERRCTHLDERGSGDAPHRRRLQFGVVRYRELIAALSEDYDPLRTWLFDLRWDGKPRLCSVLGRIYPVDRELMGETPEAADDPEERHYFEEYLSWCSASMFVSVIARLLHPGEHLDTFLHLAGPGESGKSSFVRSAFPDWLADQVVNSNFDWPTAKAKQLEAFMRYAIIENPDMAGSGRLNAEARKAIMDQPTISGVRLAYEHRPRTHRLSHVMVTTADNPGASLNDDHNLRRDACVVLKGCGGALTREAFIKEREQLWAEALCAVILMPRCHVFPAHLRGLQKRVNKASMKHDGYAGDVREWMDTEPLAERSAWTLANIGFCLGLDYSRLTHGERKALAKAVRDCGFESKPVRFEGERKNRKRLVIQGKADVPYKEGAPPEPDPP